MKVKIDEEGCIRCGLCVDICPTVFHIEGDSPAQTFGEDVPEDQESLVIEAQESCPVSVIIADK